MLRNYIVSSIRNLINGQLFTAINILGLSTSFVTCLIIYLWVERELSYDDYHRDAERIFRVSTTWDGNEGGHATTYPMMKERVLENFPEVEACARLFDVGFLGDRVEVRYEDKVFTNDRFYYGDAEFFEIFSTSALAGNAKNLFEKPNAVVISSTTAAKYFGGKDPIGKILLVGNSKELEITGVIKDIPANTHFSFDIIANMQSHPWIKHAENNVWSGIVFHTYVRLKEGTSPDLLQQKISDLLDNFPNDPKHFGQALNMVLQPVRDIHLYSNYELELRPNGNITYVYLFITIGLLVLTVACINYINLSTARYARRVKEVGIRKVMGATRKQLGGQFMMEAVITVLSSLLLAMSFVILLQPLLFEITEQAYDLKSLYTLKPVVALLTTAFILALATGLFPALLLSGFKPVKLFKPEMQFSPGGGSLRRTLIVFQFATSIILMVSAGIVYKQLQFVQGARLGYDKDQIIVLDIGYDQLKTKYIDLKSRLLGISTILHAAAASQLPTNIREAENIDVGQDITYPVSYISVDEDFFNTLGIEIKSGNENISTLRPDNKNIQFVLNESALDLIGWDKDNALQKSLVIRHGTMKPGPVVGTVSDFHFQSLHNPIGPLVIEFTPDRYKYLLLKTSTEDIGKTLESIEREWKIVAGFLPFDFRFLDNEYNSLYRNEKKVGLLFLAFTFIATFIAIIGLFGLVSYALERRTREIGIRKVLGASTPSIMRLLSLDFIWAVLTAFIIAAPTGYFLMKRWLTNFSYKTEIGIAVFVGAGLTIVVLVALILTYHGARASRVNPVDILKYE